MPGQIIDTMFGTRFVPGKISEVDGEVNFTPAQIVQTDQGMSSNQRKLLSEKKKQYYF